MKLRVFMRVARDPNNGKPKVVATTRPSDMPVRHATGEFLPTVAFAIDLDLPDAMFRQAERVIAELTIPESAAQVVADVEVVDP